METIIAILAGLAIVHAVHDEHREYRREVAHYNNYVWPQHRQRDDDRRRVYENYRRDWH